ncbi:MAG: M20/M25/M40 family metallo-hydrolase [Thermodesulfovibrionales bacterium]|nr:M20/M25/M40 family metallo-hydrolase [Thermodesulfovibrionales bacterium]
MINKERIIDTFTRLIKINSPSFDEHKLINFIKEELYSLGLQVHIQDYGQSSNLIAFKKGNLTFAPTLILNAHTDTVESTEEIDFVIDNEKIKSSGKTILGSDDKSGIAQIIEAIRVIDEMKINHGDIELVFTSAEEKGLIGAKNLDTSLLKGRHAIILDCSGPVGNIIVAAPTHLTYTMKIKGKSAHAGIEPEKGINAIRIASEIINSIPDGRLDEITTANIGFINGGSATNIVPESVVVKGEIRSHDRVTLDKNWQIIPNKAEEITKKRGAELDLNAVIEYESFRIDENDDFLNLIKEVYKTSGLKPLFTITGGGSDANIFNKNGIKAINLSNGMQAVHTKEEFIMIDDLIKGAEVIVEIIKRMEILEI